MMLNLPWKINSTLVLLFSCLASAQTTFETIYNAAKNNSPEYKSIVASQQAKEALLTSTTSAFWPRLGLESRYESFDSKYEKLKGGTANAFLSWNIFNGFQDYSKRVMAKVDFDQSENELKRYQVNFIWKIKSAYSRTYSLQKSVEIYKEAIKSNQSLLARVKSRQSSGLVSQGEYLEFDLFDSKLKLEYSAIESEYQAALTSLRALSGLDDISRLSSDLEPVDIQLNTSYIDQLIESDQSKLKIDRLVVEAAEAQRNLALGGFLPEIDLKATYGSLGLRETLINPESAFAIVAKWELFSGFDTLASRKVAMSKIVQAEAELKKQRTEYKSQVELLLKKLKNIIDRLKLENQNKDKVERYWNSIMSEYKRGIRNSSDLKGATELALQSSIKIAQLKADYFETREKMQDLLGFELNNLK